MLSNAASRALLFWGMTKFTRAAGYPSYEFVARDAVRGYQRPCLKRSGLLVPTPPWTIWARSLEFRTHVRGRRYSAKSLRA